MIENNLDTINGEFRPLLDGLTETGNKEQEENLKLLFGLVKQLNKESIMLEMIQIFGAGVTSIGRKRIEGCAKEIAGKTVRF